MKYFLFDIGNVLLDFEFEKLLLALADGAGQPVRPLSERDVVMHDAVETGDLSDEKWVEYLNETRGLSWTVDDLVGVWSGIFSTNETGRGLFRDAVAAGVPVHILSNIGGHHVDAIKSNWSGFFDGVAGLFLSYQIGLRKPDPAIYHHVLEHLDAEGSQCFFIDDRPENIEAALAEGINAHHFVPENHAAIRQAAAEFFGWAQG